MRPFFLKFSLKVKISFDIRVAFFFSVDVTFPLSSSNGEN